MPATDVFAAGSTALVTGGASGIGLAVAKLCRSKGMKVVLVDRNADALQQAEKDVAEAGSSDGVVSIVADVSHQDDWKAIKDKALSTFGSIELLALNAGTGSRGTWGDDDYFRMVGDLQVPKALAARSERQCSDQAPVDAGDEHLWRRQWSQHLPPCRA